MFKPNTYGSSTVQRTVALIFGVLVIVALFLAWSQTFTRTATAAPSTYLNFQARLRTSTGSIVPDGNYNIEFKLYDAASGGNLLWTETRTSTNQVRVANGYLSVSLGSVTAFPSTIPWGEQLWLTMNIGGTSTPDWDGEMDPRLQMTAVPHAFHADTADVAEGLTDGTNTFTSDSFIHAAPGTVQGINSANAAIRLNQTGAGDLLQLQADGSDALVVSGTGNATFSNNVSIVGQLSIGTSDTTGTLLVLDTKTNSGDPSGVNGAIYYNSDAGKFRCYEGGDWKDCISAATASAITATYVVAANDSPSHIKAVADYVADGTADHVEINAALTAGAGGKVYLAEGTYVASETILIPNNTTLEGAGKETVIELADIDASDNLIEAAGSNRTGQAIRNLTIDGRKDLNTAGTQNGIFLTSVGSASPFREGATIDNVTVQNFRSFGIFINSSSNYTITANTVNSNGSSGIYLYDSSNNNTITGNTITGNSQNGIVIYSTSNSNTITGNTITGNSNSGIYLYWSSSNTITSNTITGNSQNGIYLYSSSNNNIISSNRIHDSGGSGSYSGIFLDASDDNHITSNHITDTAGTAYAINISNNTSDNNYLADNIYSGTGATAINDAGTGTIYGGQTDSSGNFEIQPTGNIELLKNTSITGTLSVSGASTFTGQATFNSLLTANAAGTGLSVTNNATVGGTLDVAGHMALGSAAGINDTTLISPAANWSSTLTIEEEVTTTSVDGVAGIINYTSLNPGATASYSASASDNILQVKSGNTQDFTFLLFGTTGVIRHYGSGDVNTGWGAYGIVQNEADGNFWQAWGLLGEAKNNGSGTISNARGGVVKVDNTSTGSIQNGHGLVVLAAGNGGGGTFTSNAGIAIEEQTAATNNTNLLIGTSTIPDGQYSIYNSSTGQNYFAGNVGIGDSSPSYLLTVGNGDLFGVNSSGNVIVTALGTANTDTVVCRNSSNILATCNSTFLTSSTAFVQGGNTFGTTATLGTNDNNSLVLETNNTTAVTIDTSQNVTVAGNLTVSGTGASSVAGTFDVAGHMAIGANAAIDDLSLLYTTGTSKAGLVVAETVTSMTDTRYRGIASLLNLNPGAGTSTQTYALEGNVAIQSGNSQNLSGTVGAANFVAHHNGNGDLGKLVGTDTEVIYDSASAADALVGSSIWVDNDNDNATINIQNGIGLTLYNSGTVNSLFSIASYIQTWSDSSTTTLGGFSSYIYSTGASDTVLGVDNTVAFDGSTTINNVYGDRTLIENFDHANTLTTVYGNYIDINNHSTGTIGTGYGLHVASANNSSGTFTTNYGIYVAPQTAAVSDYGIAIGAADTQTLWVSQNTNSTTAAGGIAFGSSRDTNLYRSGANVLRTDDAFSIGGQLLAHIGSENAPGYSFSSDTDTGMYLDSGTLGFSVGGNNVFWLEGSAFGSDAYFELYNSAEINGGTLTVNSGTLTVNNGSSAITIAEFEDNGTNVVTIFDGGATQFRNAVNSTTAMTIQTANGSDTLFVADTSNNRLTVGNATGTNTATTLLVLDSATTDRSTGAVNGAMYYNSSSGKFRCYEGGVWKDCISTATSVAKRRVLTPEFQGATLTADGSSNSGIMTSDYVSGLASGQGYKHNYYQWSTSQSSAQDYDIVVTHQLPTTYSSMGAAATFRAWAYAQTTTGGAITWIMEDVDGTQCFSQNLTLSTNTWVESGPGSLGSCSFAANDIVVFKFKMTATSSTVNLRLGEFRFDVTE